MAPSIYRLITAVRPRWRRNAFRTMIGLALIALTAAGAGRMDAAETGFRPPGARWPFAEKRLGDFNAMVKERRIRVLVVYSKTYYFLDRGQQRGAAYELVKEFEKYVNKKFKNKTLQVQVVIIPVRRDELIEALVGGFGDIAVANLTITAERKKRVDFSAPFLTGVDELLVTGPTAPALTGLDDLAGREIHVRRSSSYYESLVDLNGRFKANGRAEMNIVAADESLEDEDLLEMVNAGLVPMIVVDSHKARFWAQIFEAIQVHDDIAVRTGGETAWMFRQKSPQLAAVVNEFAAGHKKGTLFGNMMLERYLRDTTYVKNSLSPKEIAKFTRMVDYFKTYADKYDFDYLMITAQAYQESGLDQGKRSPAGAIGVMQLLPSTAADPNIGIADIEKLEKNIQAGTKYLRFIVDRYYKDEPMNDANKLLFAFASYNAGPARVMALRKKAGTMGLDPNLWFHNVEIAAANDIGRETVQYVGNIYKYYIAYRMIADHTAKNEKAVDKSPF